MLPKLTGHLLVGALMRPIGKLVGAQAEFTGILPSEVGVLTAGCLGCCQSPCAVGASRTLLTRTRKSHFFLHVLKCPLLRKLDIAQRRESPDPVFPSPRKKGEFETEGHKQQRG